MSHGWGPLPDEATDCEKEGSSTSLLVSSERDYRANQRDAAPVGNPGEHRARDALARREKRLLAASSTRE